MQSLRFFSPLPKIGNPSSQHEKVTLIIMTRPVPYHLNLCHASTIPLQHHLGLIATEPAMMNVISTLIARKKM